MNLDHNRQAEAQHRTPDREAAIARYYRDFLPGRALPVDDHLAALFDRLDHGDARVVHHGPEEHAMTAQAIRR